MGPFSSMHVCAINDRRGTLLAERVEVASSFLARFVGLMGRRDLPLGDGLHLVPCDSIHTFFMRIPIDALFLSAEGEVLRIDETLVPWRTVLPVKGARSVLELPAGTVRASRTRQGDRVRFDSRGDRG